VRLRRSSKCDSRNEAFDVNIKEQVAEKKGKINLKAHQPKFTDWPLIYAHNIRIILLMFKWIRRLIVLVVVLILGAVGIAYTYVNSIICSAIQRQATASLGVQTTLDSAHLAIFSGNLSLNDLKVSSPPNFSAPSIFTLGDIGVTVQYGQLTNSPVHIHQIVIDKPVLVVQQSNIQLNLDALMKQMPQAPKTSSGSETQPIKLVIDELDLNNAQVTFMPGIPGLADTVQVPVPSVTLKNIGNADGNQTGAAIKEVIMQTATAMAAKAVDASNLSQPVKLVLSQEISALSTQQTVSGQIQNIAGALTKQVAPKLQNTVDQLLNGKKPSGK
jgi:uncharacterized protein involved in outer membrane biogenesis